MSATPTIIAINELNHKQKKFVKYYIQSLNAKQAAEKAGYDAKNVNKWAYKLMKSPNIKLAIKQEMECELADIDLIKARAVKALMTMAFGDMEDFVEWKGNKVTVKDSKNLSYDQRMMIQSVKENVNNAGISTVELKFYDRQKALDQLGKYLELYTHKLKISGDKDNPVQVDHNHKIDLSDLSTEELLVMKKILAKQIKTDEIVEAEIVDKDKK